MKARTKVYERVWKRSQRERAAETAKPEKLDRFQKTSPSAMSRARLRVSSSGNPWSGLDPNALGAVYRGRAEFRKPTAVPAKKAASIAKEAQRRQTIAERKAAAVGAGDTENEGKES